MGGPVNRGGLSQSPRQVAVDIGANIGAGAACAILISSKFGACSEVPEPLRIEDVVESSGQTLAPASVTLLGISVVVCVVVQDCSGRWLDKPAEGLREGGLIESLTASIEFVIQIEIGGEAEARDGGEEIRPLIGT